MRLGACLGDWQSDHSQRQVAKVALGQLITDRESLGVSDCNAELRHIRGLATALSKFDVRHRMVVALDKALPPPDSRGRRMHRVEYRHKAGGEIAGRAFVNGLWTWGADDQLRCTALQGMPADLRAKLTGKYADIHVLVHC